MKPTLTFQKNERIDFSDINCHFWSGTNTSEHTHSDYYEILIALEGPFFNTVNGMPFLHDAGDAIILKPHTYHRVFSTSPSLHYNIAVKTTYFESMLANQSVLKRLLQAQGYLHIPLSDETFPYVRKIIYAVQDDHLNAASLTFCETILSCIFSEFMLHNMRNPVDNGANDVSAYCMDAIHKIRNGAFLQKTLQEIYAEYPFSHTVFIKTFKTLTNKTPAEYLSDVKLLYAKKMLLTTDKSVLTIAIELGYNSLSHFIKKFKAAYGITPLRFRKTEFQHAKHV